MKLLDSSPFARLCSLWNLDRDNKRKLHKADCVSLLEENGIKKRGSHCKLVEVNLSIPTSDATVIVMGLRYEKEDESNREDHFVFSEGAGIEKYYGKKLEKRFPEYKGTHEYQLPKRVLKD